MSSFHRVVLDTSTLVSAALVLACAADALVSSDADLLVLHPWRGVPIVTPGGFLINYSLSP